MTTQTRVTKPASGSGARQCDSRFSAPESAFLCVHAIDPDCVHTQKTPIPVQRNANHTGIGVFVCARNRPRSSGQGKVGVSFPKTQHPPVNANVESHRARKKRYHSTVPFCASPMVRPAPLFKAGKFELRAPKRSVSGGWGRRHGSWYRFLRARLRFLHPYPGATPTCFCPR